jgi:thymidylate kinase
MLQNKVFNSLFIIAITATHDFNLAIRILSAKNTYDVIILDRFIHDTIVNNLYFYKKDPLSLFSQVLLRAWPLLLCKPDIILVLYSTPKELKRRRDNELTLTEAFDKVVTYQRYSQLWKASLINSTKDFMEVHLEVLETILKRFYGKPK